jgi:DHA2 family multidrug resistance protein
VGHLNPYNPIFQQHLHAAAGALAHANPAGAQQQAYGLLYGALQQQSTLCAYIDTFRVLAFLSLCCVPAVWFIRKVRHGAGPVMAH